MHVHIHNELDNVDQPMNQAEWDATGIAGHRVTIGSTPEDFLAQAKTVEALIAPTRGLKKLDLFATPKLRLLQLTSAGVDSLQPFDRIPPDVLIMNNRGTHGDKAGEYALMAILMLVSCEFASWFLESVVVEYMRWLPNGKSSYTATLVPPSIPELLAHAQVQRRKALNLV